MSARSVALTHFEAVTVQSPPELDARHEFSCGATLPIASQAHGNTLGKGWEFPKGHLIELDGAGPATARAKAGRPHRVYALFGIDGKRDR
jgi:hypothetical protein